MATVTPTTGYNKKIPSVMSATWALGSKTTTDTFNPEEISGADRSIQIVGAAGAGGFNSCTVQIHGSNDGTNFVVLTDGLGNNLSFTAAGIKQIYEMTRYIKAVVSSGTGGTTLTAIVCSRN